MNAIERLKRDHQILRAKLDVLESGLRMGPDAWFVLREVCFTLSRQLRDHIKREEALVAACRKALSDAGLSHMAVEHKDEPQLLRTINRLFIEQPSQDLALIRPRMAQFIAGMRHHMDEEERELFPTIERHLSVEPGPNRPARAARFDEAMTVNRVIREYPHAKPVLERLFINVPCEGACCLDEVAWRHGMDAQDLISKLEEVIAPCGGGGLP